MLDMSQTGQTWSESREIVASGPVRYRIFAEYWRNEWVPPGKFSVRLRNDEQESSIRFIVDTDGSTALGSSLIRPPSRWLWFEPKVLADFNSRRNAHVVWYTRQTGSLKLPNRVSIHFGINDGDLVNVYAKDIGELDFFWQRIWSATNVTPDAKVCAELLASQMKSQPANTTAPETLIRQNANQLDQSFADNFGRPLFKPHTQQDEIWRSIHRFNRLRSRRIFSPGQGYDAVVCGTT